MKKTPWKNYFRISAYSLLLGAWLVGSLGSGMLVSGCKVATPTSASTSTNPAALYKGLIGSWRMISSDFLSDQPSTLHYWVIKINAGGYCDWFEIYQSACTQNRTICTQPQAAPGATVQPAMVCQCTYTIVDNQNAVIELKYNGPTGAPGPGFTGTFNYSFYRHKQDNVALGISNKDQHLQLTDASGKSVNFIEFTQCPDPTFATNPDSNQNLGTCANCQ